MSDHKRCPACGQAVDVMRPRVELGEVMLDSATRAVEWKGRPVRLTATQFEVAEALIRRPGAVVSPDWLLDNVLPYAQGRDTVKVTIFNLRRAFRKADLSFDVIETVPLVGYQWRDRAVCS